MASEALARADGCEAVLAAIGAHWQPEALIAHQTGIDRARLRRCLHALVDAGLLETPRGAYRGTMWRRTEASAHHSS